MKPESRMRRPFFTWNITCWVRFRHLHGTSHDKISPQLAKWRPGRTANAKKLAASGSDAQKSVILAFRYGYEDTYTYLVEGSLETKVPTIWTDEKQHSQEEAEPGRNSDV